MFYQPKHFVVEELVCPKMHELRGEKALQLFDSRALESLDKLRRDFGPAYVNNWHVGGRNRYRGFRTPDSPYFSPTSQHAHGRAFDVTFKDVPVEEVRRYIWQNQTKYPFIKFLECDVEWLHFDVRNVEELTLWSPTRGILEAL